jgi:DNA replication and repair protein RecF
LPNLCPILQAKLPVLKSIIITQFKNYPFAKYVFNQRIVGIYGQNGKGKTNLLDAIYHLAFTKSYFLKADSANVQHGQDGYRIQGTLNQNTITIVYRGLAKKEILFNGVAYNKASQHIGKYPIVFVAPDDTALITEGGEGRRRFLDILISQTDPDYLQALSAYNKILQQRNSLLKQFATTQNRNMALLQTYNQQLLTPANLIYTKRSSVCSDLLQLINFYYNKISNNNEVILMQYESALHQQNFDTILNNNIEKDIILQRTSSGIHKDDIVFSFNEGLFKNLASQGQRKSLLFAIKLAEFALLKKLLHNTPILLLDDVFEKLDEQRMDNLLHFVCNENDGQVFITDTHSQRLSLSLQKFSSNFQILEIS